MTSRRAPWRAASTETEDSFPFSGNSLCRPCGHQPAQARSRQKLQQKGEIPVPTATPTRLGKRSQQAWGVTRWDEMFLKAAWRAGHTEDLGRQTVPEVCLKQRGWQPERHLSGRDPRRLPGQDRSSQKHTRDPTGTRKRDPQRGHLNRLQSFGVEGERPFWDLRGILYTNLAVPAKACVLQTRVGFQRPTQGWNSGE